MIQTEEINQFFKKGQPYRKNIQALPANLGTVLPRTSEQIGGRPIIHHQVSDIQFPLAVHQCQYMYICN